MSPGEEESTSLFRARGSRGRVGGSPPLAPAWASGAGGCGAPKERKINNILGKSLKSLHPPIGRCDFGGDGGDGSAAGGSLPRTDPPPAAAWGRSPLLPPSRANRATGQLATSPPVCLKRFPVRAELTETVTLQTPRRRGEQPPEPPPNPQKVSAPRPLGKKSSAPQEGDSGRCPPAPSSAHPASDACGLGLLTPPAPRFHLKEFMTRLKTEAEREPRKRDAVMSPGD